MRAIKLMADYLSYPLWDASPGGYGDIDPKTLPISQVLQQQLIDWALTYDQTLDMDYPPDSGFESVEAVMAFNRTGAALASQLRQELGTEYTIIEKFIRDEKFVRKPRSADG